MTPAERLSVWHLAADGLLLADDEALKRGPWQHAHEPHETRSPLELGAADAVVDEDVRLRDGPALGNSERLRVLDLPRDALRVPMDVLAGGLAGVDGGVHDSSFTVTDSTSASRLVSQLRISSSMPCGVWSCSSDSGETASLIVMM
jgi:hypothetical protein